MPELRFLRPKSPSGDVSSQPDPWDTEPESPDGVLDFVVNGDRTTALGMVNRMQEWFAEGARGPWQARWVADDGRQRPFLILGIGTEPMVLAGDTVAKVINPDPAGPSVCLSCVRRRGSRVTGWHSGWLPYQNGNPVIDLVALSMARQRGVRLWIGQAPVRGGMR